MKSLSVRIDSKAERAIGRLARSKGISKSAVVREAIEVLCAREFADKNADTPFERVKDLVGCVRGGPTDLSVETGRKFRKTLVSRRNRSVAH